ncbi:MAG: MBL fold metallo-hydrolase, partial [Dehalococcoidia bacterium]|nr:MBL fold metallo-hydrolase [Dehalococcoidia bacterium]
PTITPNVSLHPQQMGNPLGDYLASLQRLEPLDVDDVLPAHEHAFTDLRGRLREIVHHHEERLDEMVQIIGDEHKTAYQVASEVVWTTGRLQDFSHWMRRAALSETLAHLEYAVQEGRLHQVRDNGLVRFKKA